MAELLSERQKTAAAICAELHKLGVAVTNPMPLDPNANLRFQVLDTQRASVLEKVGIWGWSPVLMSYCPRITFQGMLPASIYEIALPAERKPVAVDDRTIKAEIETKRQTAAEVEAVKKHLGL